MCKQVVCENEQFLCETEKYMSKQSAFENEQIMCENDVKMKFVYPPSGHLRFTVTQAPC